MLYTRVVKNKAKKHFQSQEVKPPQQVALKSLKDIINFYRLNWTILLLIAVVTTITYANGLGGQFLSADDIPGIVQNPKIRQFGEVVTTLNIVSIYTSVVFIIFNGSPVAFHMGTLVFHILNTYLVLLLAYQLFGKRVALYACLIFCLLPSGSEAVFWIAGMGYVFQAFFSLLCINLYLLFRSTKNWRFLVASTLIYAFALIFLQTPWMLTVPFIIVALDLFVAYPLPCRPNPVSELKARGYYLVYFFSAGAFWAILMKGAFAHRATALVTDYYFNPAESTALLKRAPYTIYKAVELYIFPWRLSFFHEEALTPTVYALMVAATITIISIIAYLLFKKSKYGGLLLVILASILPTLSPVQVAWFMAERYLYLGGAFFAMLVSLLLIKVDHRYSLKNLANYILAVLLIFYSVRLVTRAGDFRTSKTLWLATQKTAPTSYRVYNNLGDVYSSEQDWDMAVASFKESIALAPNYADAIHNLGFTYMLMGDYENAKKYLLESYQKNGRLYQALEKLGQIELKQGNTEKAQEYFEEVRRVNAGFVSP
ncbi:hypothetical protein COT50_00280 [candidate division WWE3 bacterium CG08_land_8_20_14_0_20_41_10]|uniref:Uncharacterized protein n=1 Tax=candidate division WWE3 bacterium CG08_land_8_20_14_0_20_41_10 TaxID=1975085 RepID=A0A2H0XCV0_UNCKA|nr:MAG: hypothetical protein COT50_00280 [candidate division WWE3 bacterium CG08_land_8_20_14_0_20_41_10]